MSVLSRMQAVAAAAGGGSLQHSAGLQHRAMQHSMMGAGAQVPAASSSGEIIRRSGDVNMMTVQDLMRSEETVEVTITRPGTER